MKWIGQHIHDFIARFRSDVYLEDLTTDSSTDILVVDSNNKICKNTSAGDDMTFNVTGDSGTPEAIVDGNTLDIAGGSDLETVVSATDTVTVNHSEIERSNGSSVASPAHGATFTAIDSLTTSSTGHVTDVNTKTVTLPTATTGTVTSVATAGTENGLTLTGGTITGSGTVTLGGTLAINNSDWSGTDLSVANGGTGASTLADNSVLTGTGTSAITAEPYLTFENTGNVSTLSSFSNQDTGDLFKIATTTHGATTITTIDDDAGAADLTLTVDGKITMTPASIVGDAFHLDADGAAGSIVNIDAGILDIDSTGISTLTAGSTIRLIAGTTSSFTSGTTTTITSGALTKFLATGGVEIENGASSGGSALLIDNDDVDQIALDIDAANTTANIVDISCNTLTTGHALKITTINAGAGDLDNTIAKIDSVKQGITGSGTTNSTLGLHVNIADEATNVGAVNMHGIQVDIDSANAGGTISKKGVILNVAADGVGDAANNYGIDMIVQDGGSDIRMRSHADPRNYCTIAVTSGGQSSIKTTDGGGNNADFLIHPMGAIRLTSAGKLERSHGANGGAGIPMGIHHYNFAGFAEGIGANWMYPDPWSDNKSPFEIVNDWGDSDIDSGSPGWDATGANGVAQWFRCGRYVVGRDCTTVGWNGWTTCSVDETDEQGIAIIRVRPAAGGGAIDPADDSELELIREWIFDGDNSNHKPEYVGADADGEQFAIDLTKGDILIPMAKATTGEALYFQVNLEVQWRDV